MALYKGNVIGDSKEGGLFKKLSDEGTEMKLYKHRDFLSDVGRAPYVTHDIETGEPTERDSWWKLYVNTSEEAVQRRIEDVKRITKFIASPKGILWESRAAGLETIQKNLKQRTAANYSKVQAGSKYQVNKVESTFESDTFWNKVWKSLKNVGASILSDIALTASTLEQTGVSGTGAHVDTFISRAYLNDGGGNTSVLNQILSYAGLTNGGKLNGGAAAQKTSDILGDRPWEKLDPDKQLYSGSTVNPQGDEGEFAGPERKYGNREDSVRDIVDRYSNSALDTLLGLEERSAAKAFISTFKQKTEYTEEQKAKLVGPSSEVVSYYAKRQQRTSPVPSQTRKNDKQQLSDKYGDWGKSGEVKTTSDEGVSEDALAKEFDQPEARYISGSAVASNYLNFTDTSVSQRLRPNGEDNQVRTMFNLPEPRNEYAQYLISGSEYTQSFSREITYRTASANSGGLQLSLSKDSHVYKVDKLQDYHYHTKDFHYNYFVDTSEDLKFDAKQLDESLGLIPFCITTITPDHRTYLNFPAYLDSYDDSYNADWESVKYVGRAENFYGYKGYSRSINLAFKVIAFRQEHLVPLYKELNRLVGVTAPSYDNDLQLFMRGTLASITIGELLRDKIGIIPSVKLSWNVDDPWEIRKDGEQRKIIQVPHVLSVSLQFTPIEKQEVREDYGAYFVFDPVERAKPAVATTEVSKSLVEQPSASFEDVEKRDRARLIGGTITSIEPIDRTRDNTSVGQNGGNIKSGPSQYDILKNDPRNTRITKAPSGTR